MNPARLRTRTPAEVRADTEGRLDQVGPLDKAALCCVAMDAGALDENVRAILEVAEHYHCWEG